MKTPQLLAVAFLCAVAFMSAHAADKMPNILIIFPDDVGWQNISAYGLGTMGYPASKASTA